MSVIEKVNSKVGNKLRKLRIQNNMTQKELADVFGIAVSSIGMYEIGMRVPNDKIKKQHPLFFNKKVDDIFF